MYSLVLLLAGPSFEFLLSKTVNIVFYSNNNANDIGGANVICMIRPINFIPVYFFFFPLPLPFFYYIREQKRKNPILKWLLITLCNSLILRKIGVYVYGY